jgi:hypothetical protein
MSGFILMFLFPVVLSVVVFTVGFTSVTLYRKINKLDK